jgi:large subunit ribosomal protein L10
MGRTLENKKSIVDELKNSLSDSQLAIVIDYKGLSVAEITDLRKRLHPTGAQCKVTKNTLMRIAVDGDTTWQPMQEFCKDSSAFLLLKEDINGAIKAYQDFQKATKKTTIRGGVMEGRALSEADIQSIGNLPPKEILMAQVAGALNAVTAKIATGINELPASLARCMQAIADKDKDENGSSEEAA